MTILLKNNITTEDVRLDRIPQFDERSRNFAISTLLGEKPLRSYTWRCNQWFDQGREGACVAYALGHELASRPAEVVGMNDNWLKNIYWEAQKNDPWEGGSYKGATPFYEGTSVLAGVKQVQQRKFFESYRWAFSLKDVLQGIGYNGPAVLGIHWYDQMYQPNQDGFIRPYGNLVGGHAILARAVNVKKKYVTLRNSWGKDWGNNGDCYISFDDLEKLLYERGEAVFLMKRTAKIDENYFTTQ